MGVVTGSFTATGSSPSLQVFGKYNIHLTGTFSATLVLKRSFDNGETWAAISKDVDGTANSYTAAMSMVCEEVESGRPDQGIPNVLVKWECTSYTSGTVNYRISQ